MARILRGLFRGLWDEVLVELLKGGFKGGRELFAERVRSYITTNPRAALVIVLLSLESDERANLMRARLRAKKEGWENRFVIEVGKLLPRMSDGSVNEPKAREILKQLNEIPSEELDQLIDFLNHDPVAEWFRYWVLGKGKEVALQAAEVVAELAALGIHFIQNQVPEAGRNINHWAANTAAPKLQEADQKLARQLYRFGDWMRE